MMKMGNRPPDGAVAIEPLQVIDIALVAMVLALG